MGPLLFAVFAFFQAQVAAAEMLGDEPSVASGDAFVWAPTDPTNLFYDFNMQ